MSEKNEKFKENLTAFLNQVATKEGVSEELKGWVGTLDETEAETVAFYMYFYFIENKFFSERIINQEDMELVSFARRLWSAGAEYARLKQSVTIYHHGINLPPEASEALKGDSPLKAELEQGFRYIHDQQGLSNEEKMKAFQEWGEKHVNRWAENLGKEG